MDPAAEPISLPLCPVALAAWPKDGEALFLLLADAPGANQDGCESWLPHFRRALDTLDRFFQWAVHESGDVWGPAAPGAHAVELAMRTELAGSVQSAARLLPALRCALMRRLLALRQVAVAADAGDRADAATESLFSVIIPSEEHATPPPSKTSATVSARLFNQIVELVCALDRVARPVAEPLYATFRSATVGAGAAEPLLLESLVDVLEANLRAGVRWSGAQGKALHDLLTRAIRFCERCGLNAPDGTAKAVRIAALLSTTLDDHDDALLDAVALANATHCGVWLEDSTRAVLEARKWRSAAVADSASPEFGTSIGNPGASGGAAARRAARSRGQVVS